MTESGAERRAITVLAERSAGPRSRPAIVPLIAIVFGTLWIDRTLGLTAFAVAPAVASPQPVTPTTLAADLADLVPALALAVVASLVSVLERPCRRSTTFLVLLLVSLVGLQAGASVAEAVTGSALGVDLFLARALLVTGMTMAARSMLVSLAEHRAVTRASIEATARAEALADAGRAALTRLREDVAAEVRAILDDALEALAGGDPASGLRLRSLAAEVIRPLSHRLATAPTPGFEMPGLIVRTRWRETLASVAREPVIPPRVLAVIAAGLAFLRTFVTDQDTVRELADLEAVPAISEAVSVSVTVDWAVIGVVFGEIALVLLLTWWGAARFAELLADDRGLLAPRVAWLATLVGLMGVAMLTLVGPLVFAWIDDGTVGTAGPVAFLASFVPLVVVTAGMSLSRAVERERAVLEQELALQIASATRAAARMQAVVAHEQHRLARSLHADVQAAVNAASLMLDHAARAGTVTPALVDEVAARVAASVERFLRGGASSRPFVERIEEVRALWSGICDVRMDVTADVARRIDGDAVTRDLIVDLIAEACANAVVHGGAHEVRVALMLEQDDEVALRVEDDGASREARWSTGSGREASVDVGQHEGHVPRGLGSDVLRASCTRFALVPGAAGTTLTASIPLG